MTANSTETVVFGTPTRTPPGSYPLTTTYDKKVTYTNTDSTSQYYGTVEFEFHCNRTSMMAKIVKDYDAETTTRYLDFYMHDAQNINSDNLNMVVVLRVNTSDNTFDLYQTRTGLSSSDEFTGYRFAVKANYSTQEATVFYHDVSGEGYTGSNYSSQANIGATTVSSSTAPNAGSSSDLRMGCASNFSTNISTISSADVCSGLTNTTPPSLAFSSSDTSMSWIEANLSGQLSSL